MIKRLFDFCFSATGLFIGAPFTILAAVIIWTQDFRNPFYLPLRVGRGGRLFRMYKLRSMVIGADASGVDSTSSKDTRITPIGRIVRKAKLDEVPQLLNVMLGHMSLVGPRPNIDRETNFYTDEERKLLDVRPGITDISSIVFSDLNDILSNSKNPNLDYNQLVRPWKSRLGLFYISKANFWMDVQLILYTLISAFYRNWTLNRLSDIVRQAGGEEELVSIVKRIKPLVPTNPPGRNSGSSTKTVGLR
jgi:lipopolysaccharide/colanic/teichoic acid biosynthesis glycosyltransferase